MTLGSLFDEITKAECERLQGLPDGYTDIEFDGMAQPCADFVIGAAFLGVILLANWLYIFCE